MKQPLRKAQKMKKHSFSLVELLVVIAIIAILASLVLGGVVYAQRKADETKTLAGAAALKTAVQAYALNHNGILPLPVGSASGDYKLSDAEYEALVEMLVGKNTNDSRNRQGTKYLDPGENYEETGFVDAWENPYLIIFDANYDDEIVLNGKTYHATVLVYSRGMNDIDDGGCKFGVNSNNKDHDDVLGW